MNCSILRVSKCSTMYYASNIITAGSKSLTISQFKHCSKSIQPVYSRRCLQLTLFFINNSSKINSILSTMNSRNNQCSALIHVKRIVARRNTFIALSQSKYIMMKKHDVTIRSLSSSLNIADQPFNILNVSISAHVTYNNKIRSGLNYTSTCFSGFCLRSHM